MSDITPEQLGFVGFLVMLALFAACSAIVAVRQPIERGQRVAVILVALAVAALAIGLGIHVVLRFQ